MNKKEEHEIGQKIAMALSDIDPKFIDEAAVVPATPSKGKLLAGWMHRYGLFAACLVLAVACVSAGTLLRMGTMNDSSNDMSCGKNVVCDDFNYAFKLDESLLSRDESMLAGNGESGTEPSDEIAQIVTSTVTAGVTTGKISENPSTTSQGATSYVDAEVYCIVESKEAFNTIAKKMKDGTSSVSFLCWLDKETGKIHNVSLSYQTNLLEIPSGIQGITISGIDCAALSASVAEMDGVTTILIPDSVETITGAWNTGDKVITVVCPSGREDLIQYFLTAGCKVEKY